MIDSFPVAVCDNIRIGRSRLVEGEAYRGKIASKRRFFFGFRLQLITTVDKQLVQFFLLPGSVVDVTALQMMQLNLPSDSEVFGDAGYTDYEQELFYADCEQIYLLNPLAQRLFVSRLTKLGRRLTKRRCANGLSKRSVKLRCGFQKKFMPLPKGIS